MMSYEDTVLAWKDPDRRDGWVGDHPAGEIALDLAGGPARAQGETLVLCTQHPAFCPVKSYITACEV